MVESLVGDSLPLPPITLSRPLQGVTRPGWLPYASSSSTHATPLRSITSISRPRPSSPRRAVSMHLADDRFLGRTPSHPTIPMATEGSRGSGPSRAGAHDRVRPEGRAAVGLALRLRCHTRALTTPERWRRANRDEASNAANAPPSVASRLPLSSSYPRAPDLCCVSSRAGACGGPGRRSHVRPSGSRRGIANAAGGRPKARVGRVSLTRQETDQRFVPVDARPAP
jgi:hypothetical protein